jgi:hypothetical protein
MTWRPQPGNAGTLCIGAAVALLGVGAIALVAMTRLPVSLVTLGLLITFIGAVSASALLLVLAIGLRTLRYELGDEALCIEWLKLRTVIPYGLVDGIYRGDKLSDVRRPRRFNVSGYVVGLGAPWEDRETHFFTSSQRPEDLSIVSTEREAYVISPVDPAAFRRELIARIEAGASEGSARVERSLPALLAGLGDGVGVAAAALSVLLLLAAVGMIVRDYSAVPMALPVQFDSLGSPLRIGTREQIFWLPGIGGAALALNGIVGGVLANRERVLARLLWLSSPVVQLLVLISVFRLLP